MWTDLIIYFTAGFIFDILITFYYIEIAENKWFGAGIMSFIITVIQTLILYELITNTNIITNAITYAVGCGVGTSLTVYINHRKRHEQTRSSAPH